MHVYYNLYIYTYVTIMYVYYPLAYELTGRLVYGPF